MNLIDASFSRAGPNKENEDALLRPVRNRGHWWSAIADGVGGQPGGKIASTESISFVTKYVQENPDAPIPQLFSAVRDHLRSVASARPSLRNMATTLTVLHLRGGAVEVGHVGDTRAYHLISDGIVDRTVDQTEVQQMIDRGIFSKESARKYPRRNILLSVMSPSSVYELYRGSFDVHAGERLILVTDGVTESLQRAEIRELSAASPSVSALCDKIEDRVRQGGPRDDYSGICIDIS